MRESEDFILNRIDKNPEVEPILDYAKKMERPDPRDFTDVYSSEEIDKDLRHLSKLEVKMDKGELVEKNKKRGEAFEIVLADQVDWMGSEALSTLSSRYDDVVNGVDVVVEFEEEKLAFAVDASINCDPAKIKEKVEKSLGKVMQGGCKVKYFQSQKDNYKGSLEGLIPVVVGLEKENADELLRTFSRLKRLEKEKKEDMKSTRNELREKLYETPLQGVFLRQIKVQLQMYIAATENDLVREQCETILP